MVASKRCSSVASVKTWRLHATSNSKPLDS